MLSGLPQMHLLRWKITLPYEKSQHLQHRHASPRENSWPWSLTSFKVLEDRNQTSPWVNTQPCLILSRYWKHLMNGWKATRHQYSAPNTNNSYSYHADYSLQYIRPGNKKKEKKNSDYNKAGGTNFSAWTGPSGEALRTHFPALRTQNWTNSPKSEERSTLTGDFINPWMRSHARNQLLQSQGRDKSLFFWNLKTRYSISNSKEPTGRTPTH